MFSRELTLGRSSTHDKYGRFQNAQSRVGAIGKLRRWAHWLEVKAIQTQGYSGSNWFCGRLPYGTGMDARDSLCVRTISRRPAGPGPFYFLFSSQVPSLSLNILKSFTPKGHPQPSPLCSSESNWFMFLIAIFLYINYPNIGQTMEMLISWEITWVVNKTCLEWHDAFSKIS